MKRLYYLLALCLVCVTAQATVLTVNNNQPSPGQYITLAAAQTAASNGDTLYIAGSPYNYNNFTVSKRLTLIGTGHKPQNQNPAVSKLDNIDFANDTTNVNGTRIVGLDVNYINLSATDIRRIEITRCKIRAYINFPDGARNILLESNYFASSTDNLYAYYIPAIYDFVIRNNVFNGIMTDMYGNNGIGNIYFQNNLFLYPGNVFVAYSTSNRTLTFFNNIFYGASPAGSISSSLFENNISYGGSTTAFSTSSSNTSINNQANVDPLFVSAATGSYSYTNDYSLSSSSPAIAAGNDGLDIGLTGGNGYFQKYGIPGIPQIRSFSITSPTNATVAPGGSLQVQVISTIKR